MPPLGPLVAAAIVSVAGMMPRSRDQIRDWQPANVQPAAIARVRSQDARFRSLLDQAPLRSATFRRLVNEIASSDGIVYVEPGRCGRHRVRSCLLHSVTEAGSFRVLRIQIDAQNDDEVITFAAHELQHALEVLDAPDVTTGQGMYVFFLSNGHSAGSYRETTAAIEAGVQVGRELKASRTPDPSIATR